MNLGIHTGIPFADYLAIEAVSASMIRDVDEHCVAYARRKRTDRDTREWTTQARGTALHAMLLEPERFKAAYQRVTGCCMPLSSGARKGEPCGSQTGRLALDGRFLCAKHDGEAAESAQTGVPAEAWTELEAMQNAVLGVAGEHLAASTHRELTLLWIDDETGLLCKARLDFISGRRCWDLKTMADIAPQRWSRTMLDYGMHFQAIHYLRGAQACGLDVDDFAWIAVRNADPYLAVVHPPLDDASLEAAECVRRDRLEKIQQAETVGTGYAVPERSSLPDWYVNNFCVAP